MANVYFWAQMDPWKQETGFTWLDVIGFHTHSVSLPLTRHHCPVSPDFRGILADFWRVSRVRINFGQILEGASACLVVPRTQ